MKKVASHALGCKVNQYESEAIAERFAERGYEIVGIDERADVYIINTCTVTNFGDKKSRQLIRKVKRQNPDAVVAAIGCYAQTAPEDIKKIDGVNLILGTKGRGDIVDLVEAYMRDGADRCVVTDIAKERTFEKLSVSRLEGRTRAYVKIQDGCSQFCSYCIIPYARGPIRSRPAADVLNEVRLLAENGFKEIVLTGIHVASYGKDLGDISLGGVIERAAKIEGIERIRFSSVEPGIITDEFMESLLSAGKVCPHFHLSLQSGCDATLKRMNRRYTAADYMRAVEKLRSYMPDVAVTTDIIAGFPGETESDFEESLAFAESVGFLKIHAFPYSPKRGTPAAKMPNQLSVSVKNERTARLIALSDKSGRNFIERFVGSTMDVLYERNIGGNVWEGYTGNYIRVTAKSAGDVKNAVLPTLIVSAGAEEAEGEITPIAKDKNVL